MSHIVNYNYRERSDGEYEIQIEAQLPAIREIMKRKSTGTRTSSNSRWDHLEVYDLPVYPMDDSYHMGKLGQMDFVINSNKVNLSWMRAVDLHEGITITLRAPDFMPMSSVRQSTATAIEDFVRRHAVPSMRFTATLDGRTIVDEQSPIQSIESRELTDYDGTAVRIATPAELMPDEPSDSDDDDDGLFVTWGHESGTDTSYSTLT